MVVLTDTPDRARGFVPGGEWTRRSRDELSARDRELWAALGATGDPWFLDASPSEPHSAWTKATDFWSRLVVISDAPASQFDALGSLLRSGDPHHAPVAVVALTGKKFHGHRGRRWEVSEGNLYLSVALAPHLPATQLGMAFSMLPAVAALDAIHQTTHGAAPVGIKWVNDIMAGSRKIGGVLATSHARSGIVESAVLGIGLNIESCPVVEPTVFVPEAGCLSETPGGEAAGLAELLPAVLGALAQRYVTLCAVGPRSLFEEYRGNSLVLDAEVRIWAEDATVGPERSWPAPLATGVVTDMLADLGLLIEHYPEPITRGRLAFEDVCRSRGL